MTNDMSTFLAQERADEARMDHLRDLDEQAREAAENRTEADDIEDTERSLERLWRE